MKTKKVLLLFFKCLCVLLPCILLSLYLVGHQFSLESDEYAFYRWNKEFCLKEHESPCDILILGDSSANAAYMPYVLSDSAANLSLGGATPMEQYFVLQDYLSHNPAPKTVFITYDDSHMDKNLRDDSTFWTRTIQYHRFTHKQNMLMYNSAREYNDRAILDSGSLEDMFYYEHYFPHMQAYNLLSGFLRGSREYNLNNFEEAEKRMGRYIRHEWRIGSDTEFEKEKSFNIDLLCDDYLRRTLDICAENNIAVHIVKLPRVQYRQYSDSYIADINAYYGKLAEEYPNVSFDFYMDIYPDDYFCDFNHMSDIGALTFSHDIREKYFPAQGDELSAGQAEALNSDIKDIQSLSDILSWIWGRNYTVLLYDSGEYLDPAGTEALQSISPAGRGSGVYGRLYMISETGDGGICSYGADGGFKVQVSAAQDFSWNPCGTDGVSTLIIDNYNGSVLACKNFVFSEGSGSLIYESGN